MTDNFTELYFDQLNNSQKNKYLIIRSDYIKLYNFIESLATTFFSKNHLQIEERTVEAFYEYIEASIERSKDIFSKHECNFEIILKPLVAIIFLKFNTSYVV